MIRSVEDAAVTESSSPTLAAAVELFNAGRYLASHELFDELWDESEGRDSDFFKGLIQAAIALHHFQSGNLEGAAKLYSGHRRFLAGYSPTHKDLDVAAFLDDMQRFCRPVRARRAGVSVPFPEDERPRLRRIERPRSESG